MALPGKSKVHCRDPQPFLPLSKSVAELSRIICQYIKEDKIERLRNLCLDLPERRRAEVANHRLVAEGNGGETSLFLASTLGRLEAVNFLLDLCGADMSVTGTYVVAEDKSKHIVTALWCAAVADHLEVVKSLVRHGADIDAPSDSGSTPVRSACYMTNVEVVRYLIAQGADIHKANVNGGTCLINSVQSVELCRMLCNRGIDVNVEDVSGNIALQYAVREGHFDSTKLLLECGSLWEKANEFGDDSLQSGALRGQQSIVELIIGMCPVVPRRIAESYDLLACVSVDEHHDLTAARNLWKKSLHVKQQHKLTIHVEPPHPALLNVQEATSIEELMSIMENPDHVYMHAVIVRERILGKAHREVGFGLMYRGALYADTQEYQRCVELWKYCYLMRAKGPGRTEAVSNENFFALHAITRLFWEMMEEDNRRDANDPSRKPILNDVLEILETAAADILDALPYAFDLPLNKRLADDVEATLVLCLHLAKLIAKIAEEDDCDSWRRFVRCLEPLIRFGACTRTKRTLLHVACDSRSSEVSKELVSMLPCEDLLRVLLTCGADPDALDTCRRTPLHVVCKVWPSTNVHASLENTRSATKVLLEAGAHRDLTDVFGKIPELSCCEEPASLQCLSARLVASNATVFNAACQSCPPHLMSYVIGHSPRPIEQLHALTSSR